MKYPCNLSCLVLIFCSETNFSPLPLTLRLVRHCHRHCGLSRLFQSRITARLGKPQRSGLCSWCSFMVAQLQVPSQASPPPFITTLSYWVVQGVPNGTPLCRENPVSWTANRSFSSVDRRSQRWCDMVTCHPLCGLLDFMLPAVLVYIVQCWMQAKLILQKLNVNFIMLRPLQPIWLLGYVLKSSLIFGNIWLYWEVSERQKMSTISKK